MKVLDLFCGVGGLSWGFEEVGWEVVGGIDMWDKALRVFKKVHSKAKVLCEDLAKFKDEDIIREFPEVDVIVGGPPCQAFSTVGKRALDDPRALLVKEFVRFVKLLRPEVFVFENVKGFVSFSKGLLVREVIEELSSAGYQVDFEVLNAVNFSAPQMRERFIIVGSLSKEIFLPRGNYVKKGNFWTFREMSSDLPPLNSGEEAIHYLSPPQHELQRFYRRKSPERLTLHYSSNYSSKILEMMKYIPEGKSAHDVIKNIPLSYRPTSGYKNTYKRIFWDEPTPTITRNFCVPSSSNCIHPEQNRALTPREAARAQTFPDDYPFEGSKQDIRVMIGNAVPPFLSLGLALRIGSYYKETISNNFPDKCWCELIDVKALLNPSAEEKLWKEDSTTKKKLKSSNSLLLLGF